MNASTATIRKRNRRRVFIILAAIVGCCGALLVAEFSLRIYVASRGWTANCYATGLVFFVPDKYAGHTLRPGLRLKSSTYDVSINSHGLRGHEFQTSKPPGVTRIAVLGGSSVFGYLVPDGQDSCCELEQILRQDGLKVEVLNAGVPGFNMTQCRLRYEHQLAPLQPDIVLLYLGWNDSRFLIAEDPREMDKTPPAPPFVKRCLAQSVLYGFLRFRLFPPAAPQFAPPMSANTRITELGAKSFDSDLSALIRSVRESGAKAVVSTQVMASNQNCSGLDALLGGDETQITANRAIGQWITDKMRSTARDEAIQLIDCARQLPCDQQMLGDAIHLTRRGHRLVAELWASELRPLLGKSSLSSSSPSSYELEATP